MSKSWDDMTHAEQYAYRERVMTTLVAIGPDIERINPGAGESLYYRYLRLQIQNEQLAEVIAREETQT